MGHPKNKLSEPYNMPKKTFSFDVWHQTITHLFEQLNRGLADYKILFFYRYELFLLFLTIIGLILKIVYELFQLEYQSDNVFGGLAAIEFWKYNNFFLSEYYVPSDDSNFFEALVFHVVPQVLSNYNPIMLKVSTFIIFSLIVIIFSYFVYRLTNNILNGLFFSAVLSNWYIFDSTTILWITSHESTILMIGVLMVLYFFKPLTRYWEIIFFSILAVVTFSDSLILVWFTIPLLLVIISDHFRTQTIKEQISSFFRFDFVFKIVFISGILMITKKLFIPYYMNHTHIFHELEIANLIAIQVPILFQHLTILIDPHFYRDFIISNSISIIDIVFLSLFVGYVILVIKYLKSHSTKNAKIFCVFTFITFIACSLLYITTAFQIQLQYLKFLLVCLLIIFCLIDFNKVRISRFILIGIIFINLFFCISYAAALDMSHNPNEEQYNLIEFLKGENLTFGYGDYWDSNVITYLSHEDITIRPILIGNGLVPFNWNSAERWYSNLPQKYFIIIRKTDEHAINYYNNTFMPKYIRVIDYRNYKIFEYNQSEIQAYTYDAVNLSHLGGNSDYDPLLQKDIWYSNNTVWGYVVYGPYVILPSGSYQVDYRLKRNGTPTQNLSVARVEISSNKILNQSTIFTTALTNDTYQTFSLTFESNSSVPLEFRVYKYPHSTLSIENIEVNVIA